MFPSNFSLSLCALSDCSQELVLNHGPCISTLGTPPHANNRQPLHLDPAQQPPLAYPVDRYVLNEVLKAGFTEPTPIQAQGWPMALLGRDLIGLAGGCTLVWGDWDQ